MQVIALATLTVAAVLALAMGSSGMAPAFAASLGAGVLSRRVAIPLYTGCVLLGAVLLGERVASTVGRGIAPAEAFTPAVTLGVVGAVALAMVLASLLRIAQSTSWVTVAAVVVVGVHHGQVDTATLFGRLLPAWLFLPLASYGLCLWLTHRLYPLRASNWRLHERIARQRPRLRLVVIAGGCYVAVAIGANNVANIVGPLAAGGVIDAEMGLLLLAPLFGAGALVLRGPADHMARDIVPIGEVTAATTSVVVGSLLLLASLLGIPQSLVQLQTAAVLAVSQVKEESVRRMPRRELGRLGAVWLGAPVLAALLTRLVVEVAP